MKKVTEPRKFTAPSAWGRDSTTTRQAFAVEASDVGKFRPNYLGHGCRAYQFTRKDVGRVLEDITMPGAPSHYHSWSWGSVFSDVPKTIELES